MSWGIWIAIGIILAFIDKRRRLLGATFFVISLGLGLIEE